MPVARERCAAACPLTPERGAARPHLHMSPDNLAIGTLGTAALRFRRDP